MSNNRLYDILHSADVGIVAQKASPYSHLVRRATLANNGKLAQLRNDWETQRATYLGVFDPLLAQDDGSDITPLSP